MNVSGNIGAKIALTGSGSLQENKCGAVTKILRKDSATDELLL